MRLKKPLLFLGLFIVVATALLFLFSGYLIKPLLEVAIRSNGFPNAQIETVRVLPQGILIENISLDADEFSTIEAAQVTGSLGGLAFGRRVEGVTLKNVEISGEINENGQYIIAGWNAGASEDTGESAGILIENINVDGMTLDFETPEGAIRIEGKLTLQSSADKTRKFQASVWGKQKQLSINANADGTILPDGQWSSDIELLEGRVDMDNIKATRANGKIKLKSVLPHGIAYEGKMAAGGVRIKDIPFQDFEVAFDSNKPETLQFKTSPTAHDGIVIAGRILNQDPMALEANIAVTSLQDLESLFALKKDDTAWLQNTVPFDLTVTAPLTALSVPQIGTTWTLTVGKDKRQLEGSAVYDREQRRLTGVMKTARLDGKAISGLFPLQERTEINLTEGRIDLEGNFASNIGQSPLQVDGAFSLKANNIGGVWQEYPFKGVRGSIALTRLWPWQTGKNQTVTIDAIGTGINLTNGTLTFDGDAKAGYAIKAASFDLGGGKVSVDPFKWRPDAKTNSMTLQLSNIDMAALSVTAEEKGFAASGKLDGSLPMTFTDKGIEFKDGKITGTSEGSFRYTPADYPAALQGDDARMETVRMALSDFRYSNLEILINGPLNGDLQTSFKANGTNPVFENRPINLNINLEGALVPALQQALQPGRIADRIEKSVTGGQ